MAFSIHPRRATRLCAAMLAALALAAPAAMAQPISDPPARASTQRVSPAIDATPKAATPANDGFDWASAGVGAAAAGGLILIAVGAFGVAYRARTRLAR